MKVTRTFQYQNIQGFKFGSTILGKPRLFSHVYFIDGLLIDTGHINMRQEVMATLSKLPINQVFITHHHEDHTGNLKDIQRYFKCPTYASLACVNLMKRPPAISFAQRMSWGNRPANFELLVKENRIETPNYSFEMIPIPGHAEDMIALYEPNEGWLFSADLWVYHYIRYFMRPESMRQQIVSIKKILRLDFDVLLCSHNPQFENGKEKLEKKLHFLESFYQQVADLYHKGYSIKAIFKAMKLKESWSVRLLSGGELSTKNMIKSVIRDEKNIGL